MHSMLQLAMHAYKASIHQHTYAHAHKRVKMHRSFFELNFSWIFYERFCFLSPAFMLALTTKRWKQMDNYALTPKRDHPRIHQAQSGTYFLRSINSVFAREFSDRIVLFRFARVKCCERLVLAANIDVFECFKEKKLSTTK